MNCTIESPIKDRTLEIVNRHLQARECPALTPVSTLPEDEPGLVMAVDPALDEETFRITMLQPGHLRVTGGSGLGILFGLGKMLRTGTFDGGRFQFGPWRGTSTPSCSLRCVYFATHFYNFYHTAPIEEVIRYVEDLALMRGIRIRDVGCEILCYYLLQWCYGQEQ